MSRSIPYLREKNVLSAPAIMLRVVTFFWCPRSPFQAGSLQQVSSEDRQAIEELRCKQVPVQTLQGSHGSELMGPASTFRVGCHLDTVLGEPRTPKTSVCDCLSFHTF